MAKATELKVPILDEAALLELIESAPVGTPVDSEEGSAGSADGSSQMRLDV